MGKLNIAHHKSYHPYRRDNIERVRKDEEEARFQEAKEEGRVALADSEARINLLRERSGTGIGIKKGKAKGTDDDDLPQGNGGLVGNGGHINFFEDIEQSSMMSAIKSKKKDLSTETEKGIALAPSDKDLNPWYATSSKEPPPASEEESEKSWKEKKKRDKDLAFKAINDPLTSITHQLASHSSSSLTPQKRQSNLFPRSPQSQSHPPPSRTQEFSLPVPPSTVQSRLARESSERERALALIAKKKREMAGSETPSTVHGGDYTGYGDLFNRKEVEEAHRGWNRGRGRRRHGEDDHRRVGDWTRRTRK